MPNWFHNDLVVTGSAEDIRAVLATGFEFDKILPTPEEVDPLLKWHSIHWGTKWDAGDSVRIRDQTETSIKLYCKTANGAPHGVLAYLTKLHPSLRIEDIFEEVPSMVGYAVYEGGRMKGEIIYPYGEYTATALRHFGATRPWFNAENIISTIVNMGFPPEKLDTGDDVVTVAIIDHSYEEFVAQCKRELGQT